MVYWALPWLARGAGEGGVCTRHVVVFECCFFAQHASSMQVACKCLPPMWNAVDRDAIRPSGKEAGDGSAVERGEEALTELLRPFDTTRHDCTRPTRLGRLDRQATHTRHSSPLFTDKHPHC